MLYEVVLLDNQLRRLSHDDLKQWIIEGDSWDLGPGASIPIELQRLSDVNNLFGPTESVSQTQLGKIERTIQKDGLYIGPKFAVRGIAGAKMARL